MYALGQKRKGGIEIPPLFRIACLLMDPESPIVVMDGVEPS